LVDLCAYACITDYLDSLILDLEGCELVSEFDIGFWFSVTLACLLGAMSPGPSLAVIVNLSLSQGRVAGLIAAISHGLMIGVFAFITASGLVVILDRNPQVFNAVQIAGCLFLIWMAAKLLFAKPNPDTYSLVTAQSSRWLAARDGLLIALVNPKIIIFFSALFSQFVDANSQLWEKMLMALIAGGVDMLWYMLMAVVITNPSSLVAYQRHSRWLDKLFALVLLIIALGFIIQIIG
jgi:threonine/homoserine/homoserine lactone efflux protein